MAWRRFLLPSPVDRFEQWIYLHYPQPSHLANTLHQHARVNEGSFFQIICKVPHQHYILVIPHQLSLNMLCLLVLAFYSVPSSIVLYCLAKNLLCWSLESFLCCGVSQKRVLVHNDEALLIIHQGDSEKTTQHKVGACLPYLLMLLQVQELWVGIHVGNKDKL